MGSHTRVIIWQRLGYIRSILYPFVFPQLESRIIGLAGPDLESRSSAIVNPLSLPASQQLAATA
jgi:hypothetical protein